MVKREKMNLQFQKDIARRESHFEFTEILLRILLLRIYCFHLVALTFAILAHDVDFPG
jgi:hypothetical protein